MLYSKMKSMMISLFCVRPVHAVSRVNRAQWYVRFLAAQHLYLGLTHCLPKQCYGAMTLPGPVAFAHHRPSDPPVSGSKSH